MLRAVKVEKTLPKERKIFSKNWAEGWVVAQR